MNEEITKSKEIIMIRASLHELTLRGIGVLFDDAVTNDLTKRLANYVSILDDCRDFINEVAPLVNTLKTKSKLK